MPSRFVSFNGSDAMETLNNEFTNLKLAVRMNYWLSLDIDEIRETLAFQECPLLTSPSNANMNKNDIATVLTLTHSSLPNVARFENESFSSLRRAKTEPNICS